MYNLGMTIAIIGAGASGMAAALQAVWNGAAVTLLERNAEAGRKLLVTGSGRCNLTNDGVSAARYACADPAWMAALIGRFGVADVLEMLAAIGIPARKTSDGWYYPISNSAQSVVEAFTSALRLAGVTLTTQAQVNGIDFNGNGFRLRYSHAGQPREEIFERLIVSAGGAAYPALGSRGELFPQLEKLGHTTLPKRPALAPLLAELGFLRSLQGMRLNVGAALWEGSHCLAETAGNLIFTEWGLNGPAVMDLSHLVSARPGSRLELSLNLLAFFQPEFEAFLAQQRESRMPVKILLEAFFAPKVAGVYLKQARLAEDLPLGQIKDGPLQALVDLLKDTRLAVKGVRGFEYCQVSAGGVPVDEADPLTLESRRVKGLYLTGETLDVVGPCGGYNLQYAFSSGALAGLAAAGG
jgi:hypothetical protein